MGVSINRDLFKRAKRWDRLARWGITVGGIGVIAAVIGILVLITGKTIPLFLPASHDVILVKPVPEGTIRAVGTGDYLENLWTVDGSGRFTFSSVATGEAGVIPDDGPINSPPVFHPGEGEYGQLARVLQHDGKYLTLVWRDGRITEVKMLYAPVFPEGGERIIQPRFSVVQNWAPAERGDPMLVRARALGDTGLVAVHVRPDGAVQYTLRKKGEEDLFGEAEAVEKDRALTHDATGAITALTLSADGTRVFAGTDAGELLAWFLDEDAELVADLAYQASDRAISTLQTLIGDETLLLADRAGRLDAWFVLRDEGELLMKQTKRLIGSGSPIVAIQSSMRGKQFLALAEDGHVDYVHLTSERHLLAIDDHRLTHLALAPRDNGMVGLSREGKLVLHRIDCPHPEINTHTLFGKVWYESYPDARFVWQSTGGSQDFESKMSLVPLLWGTLKGTFYAMLFAMPLAVFGAVYISQFASPGWRSWIKPAVELMAGLPSVVIGFLCALWLAPTFERWLTTTLCVFVLIVPVFMLFLLLWQTVRTQEWAKRVERGGEFFVGLLPLTLTILLAVWSAPWVEAEFFNGDMAGWLYQSLDLRYDQRNCIVIAFGLGFAVIPIVFSISEDALSNVPNTLSAASLALGASRWQTVWRVILPSASPGIFAATMIGFGRAVGETMIVLMATGNTPIIDWSPFNGMRTLSANIAVEVPEAPVDGTLYRVLFLCAVLLFSMTFVLNTVAELVRHRLRKKYGRF